MAQDITIPDIGDADDVEVVEIIAAAGDEVGEDDPIIVIESDKASMEVPAGKSGVIESITVSVGDKVSEGQVIAKLKDAGSSGDASSDDTSSDDTSTEETASGDEKDKDAAQDGADERADERADEPADEDESDDEAGDEPADEADDEPDDGKSTSSRTVEIRLPDAGDAEGIEVIEVAVKAGDTVSENDVLVVVESDKASMEIPSGHAGTIKEVHVSEGSEVEEGTLLVTLETAAEPGESAGDKQPEPEAKSDTGKKPEKKKSSTPKDAPASQEPSSQEPSSPERSSDRDSPPSSGTSVYAGPSVRRLARELGVDLKGVEGTGNRGRIVKDDVKSHVKSRMTGAGSAGAGVLPAMPEVDFSKFGEVEEQALSRIRARGAENLHRSWVNIPHVTQHDEVDVTDLEDFRASLKAEGERRGVKVTPLAFIIKACCQVLKEFPTFNASLDPAAKKFILKHYYHIGMAVDTPDGLVVPVIRDADTKGIWELSAEVLELAEKARDKKLSVNDMQGGSFSVSSLGAIGGTGFTPVINAPEVAILGVSRLTTRPVWKNEAFVPRKMLPLSLSYDHRAVNGAEAGRFVARLGELLSDIRRLALG